MKKLLISCIISMTLVVFASAQNGSGTLGDPYYGTISTSVTWDLNNFPGGVVYIGKTGTPTSTYNDITINSGGHLTIGSGITITFQLTTSDLIITGSGLLTASGTSSASVVFTKASAISHWGHISFETPGSPTPISGSGTFDYCLVEYGYAATSGTNPDNAGGGIQVNATNVTITNCLFRNNYSNFGGAVTVNAGRNTIIRNSRFKSNSANEAGGAVLLWTSSTAVVENCIFEYNYCKGASSALYSGGAIWCLSNTSKIVNCTFVENTSDRAGDAIYSYTSSGMRIINSILWGSNDQFAGATTTSTIVTCAFESAKPSNAANSIIISDVANDHFVNAVSGDWTLKFISPCRDAGVNSYAGVTIPTTDYIGNPTVYTKDIGAYEVQYSRWKTTATSTDWSTAANWVASVDPATGTGDVYIPSGLTNYPTGSPSQNFTIGSGKFMTLEPGAKATLGTLTNNGTLRLQSSASGISSLIVTTFSGNDASVELFLTGGGIKTTYKWHYISTPVSSLPVSTFAPGTTRDVAQFIESRPTLSLREGWVAYDGFIYSTGGMGGPTFSYLTPGKGYDYWDNLDNKFTFSGQLNTADAAMALGFSGDATLNGFNLLGNPFSSGLNWDDIINSVYYTYPSSTSKGIYFTRDNVQCTYIGGVGIPGDVTGIIPPMQGFFTKTYSTGNTITLPAAARVQDYIHARYKGSTIIPLVRLSLAEDTLSDETVVRFDIAAKSDIDYDYDALKMFLASDIVSIYSSLSGIKYAINGLPFPETFVEIPIVVNLTKDTIHTISATQLQGLDNYIVTLTDNTTGFTADLKTTPVLTFSAAAGTITDRFILKVSTITTGTENPVASKNIFNIYPSDRLINIQTIADEWDGKSGSVKILDLTGKTVTGLEDAEFSRNSIVQVPGIGAKGLYVVEIRSGVMKYVGKVIIK